MLGMVTSLRSRSDAQSQLYADGASYDDEAFAARRGIVASFAVRDPRTRRSRANSFSRSSRILAILI